MFQDPNSFVLKASASGRKMGEEYEGWSIGCFYGPGLDMAHTTSIHIPMARAQSYCLPSSKRAWENLSNHDPRQKRNWVCDDPAFLATMFFHYSPIRRICVAIKVRQNATFFEKHFLTTLMEVWEFPFLKFHNTYYLCYLFYTCHSSNRKVVFLFDCACLIFPSVILSFLKV